MSVLPVCDAHLHIYDPQFPYVPGASLTPASARVPDYHAVQRALGLTRAVIVQPSSYGTDNRCTLAAVRALGADCARAVVVVDLAVPDAVLERYAAQGACGIRVNAARGQAFAADEVMALCHRIAGLGWHLQWHAPAETSAALAPWLARLPVPVVIDHFARLPPTATIAAEPYLSICRLLDTGRFWVKLSAPYLVSAEGPPDYGDLDALLDDLVSRAPQRLVWGSDWPHPGWVAAGGAPLSEQATYDWVRRRLSSTALTRAVLCENPQRLYGFSPVDTDV